MDKIEAEMKFRVLDFDSVRYFLNELGAKRICFEDMTDTYYDVGDAELLRVRHAMMDELTYKGPKIVGKSRVERSVHVRDINGLIEILDEVLCRDVTVHKHREIWNLGRAYICLDTVDGLGQFVEIEIVSNEEKLEYDLARIKELAANLLLKDEETMSYAELSSIGCQLWSEPR